jgi:hypothetical protein
VAAAATQRIERTDDHTAARLGRSAIAVALGRWGRCDLLDDAQLVGSELVTNALLHTTGSLHIVVRPIDEGVRIEVHDESPHLPLPCAGQAPADAMTGRGLGLVEALSARWGADETRDGKCVWAELSIAHRDAMAALDDDALLDLWADAAESDHRSDTTFRIEIGEVPTDLLLDVKAQLDNALREISLIAGGSATAATPPPPGLEALIGITRGELADARHAMKRQAIEAQQRGEATVCLTLDLPAGAADAAERYLAALDEVDRWSREAKLLTLEAPERHRVVRRWYLRGIIEGLRCAAAGEPPREPEALGPLLQAVEETLDLP